MAKKITLNVNLPVVVTLEGEGKLDMDTLKQQVIEFFSERENEELFCEAMMGGQDEFEGNISIGTIKFKK